MVKFDLHPDIVWATSTIHEGNMSFHYGDRQKVKLSRNLLLKQLNPPLDSFVGLQVEHRSNIHLVTQTDAGLGMYSQKDVLLGDVLITQTKGLGLFLLTADCIPLVFYSSNKGILGLAHLGWRNLTSDTLVKLHDYLLTNYQCSFDQLSFGVGPSVRQLSYVKRSPKQASMPEWSPYLRKMGVDVYAIDLVGFTINQIVNLGGKLDQIVDSKINTFSDSDYFSHAQSGVDEVNLGRFATIVYLKK